MATTKGNKMADFTYYQTDTEISHCVHDPSRYIPSHLGIYPAKAVCIKAQHPYNGWWTWADICSWIEKVVWPQDRDKVVVNIRKAFDDCDASGVGTCMVAYLLCAS